jgi:hypothetical protein
VTVGEPPPITPWVVGHPEVTHLNGSWHPGKVAAC